ncbi:Protein SEY1 [Trichinella pseudospiralis]
MRICSGFSDEAWDGNLNSACCFTRPKEGTLALIPLLRNYALPDHNYLFCVAPRENIHASFLVKLHFIALRHTTVTAVHKADTVDISMDEYPLQNNTNCTDKRSAGITPFRNSGNRIVNSKR